MVFQARSPVSAASGFVGSFPRIEEIIDGICNTRSVTIFIPIALFKMIGRRPVG